MCTPRKAINFTLCTHEKDPILHRLELAMETTPGTFVVNDLFHINLRKQPVLLWYVEGDEVFPKIHIKTKFFDITLLVKECHDDCTS